jgi:DNA-binding NtrC family response regulator
LRVDVRVIAATNQDLEEAIRERRFREDLFYRLNVIPIEAPPLRERREDIPLLVEHFLERASRARGRPAPGLSGEALDLLCSYDWPGNVRELENLIERLVTLGGDREIAPADLPRSLRQQITAPALAALRVPATGLSFRHVIETVEDQLIRDALEQTHGNKNQAARLLDMNRTTLLEKLKRRPPAAAQAPAAGEPRTDGFATGAGLGRRNSDAFAAGRPHPPPGAAAPPRKRLRNGRPHPPRQMPDESGT